MPVQRWPVMSMSSIPHIASIALGKPPETCFQMTAQKYLGDMCGQASTWCFSKHGFRFLLFWTAVHTRPDGDLENLAIEKGNFIDLKIALLRSASHWVLVMDALTCLTS